MEHYPQVYAEIDHRAQSLRPVYTMRNCLRAICLYYSVTQDEVKSASRMQRIAIPRHHFCWVVYRNRIDVSYPMIGRFLGRDHTTIVHSVAKFDELKTQRCEDVTNVNSLILSMNNT